VDKQTNAGDNRTPTNADGVGNDWVKQQRKYNETDHGSCQSSSESSARTTGGGCEVWDPAVVDWDKPKNIDLNCNVTTSSWHIIHWRNSAN